MYDVVIIGAGPVGLYTAYQCEKMGFKVAVIEEDKEIGKPLKCSGLISRNVKKFFPDIESWNVIENEIDTAKLHSRRGELSLKKPGAAYVINRTLFDRKISEMVESKIWLGHKARDVVLKDGLIEIATNKRIFKGAMTAVCDGPNSIDAGKRKTVNGLIAIANEADGSNGVDLFFDKKRISDGFFWKIPRGKTTEYGAWGSRVNFSDIERFFGISGYEKHAGIIPVGPVKKSYSERRLMIGSSAGQVKPWSGGGVVYGLACSKIGAGVIKKAFDDNDFSENALKEYELKWRAKIGRQIRMGLIFRKFLERSNDFQIDAALRAGKLFRYGWMDMDFIV